MALQRIYIEVDEVNPDGSVASLSGYGDGESSGVVFLADGETVLGLMASLKPYADHNGLDFIEVPIEAIQ